MKKIVFLVSGGGSNLKFVHEALKILKVDATIVGVIADRDIQFKDYLINEKIYFSKIKYNKNYNKELLSELIKLTPDVIVTNIHKIIDSEVLIRFNNKFINLHYSLLPAFSGLIGMKTVELAKCKNVQFIGGTCHEVNEEVDAGKILFQSCFSIDDWEKNKFENIVDTVFKSSCLLLISGILSKIGCKLGNLAQSRINNFEVNYSPTLYIESQEFAENIFKKLK